MLDVITDFWKPARKSAQENKVDWNNLQEGATVAFEFVPQPLLSGRRFKINAINTYEFPNERHTSYVLQEGPEFIAMIMLDSEGTKYLSISRRIPESDLNRMFNAIELQDAIAIEQSKRIQARDIDTNWKNWVVGNYTKDDYQPTGKIYKGDYRTLMTMPDEAIGQSFKYITFKSDSNEYAIEVERYDDGRTDVYATIYRRVNDIKEIVAAEKPAAAAENAPQVESSEVPQEAQSTKPTLVEEAKPAVETPAVKVEEPKVEVTALAVSAPVAKATPAAAPVEAKPTQNVKLSNPTENKPMSIFNPLSANQKPEASNGMMNGSAQPAMQSSAMVTSPQQANIKQEVKAVSNRTAAEMENEAIECDLRVANKIIEEAIRNELRLSDVVRRIIALPVAYPESVQIPITLSDSDFQLLAIRYGITATDRNAIKTKIIEEINDFSGGTKQ